MAENADKSWFIQLLWSRGPWHISHENNNSLAGVRFYTVKSVFTHIFSNTLVPDRGGGGWGGGVGYRSTENKHFHLVFAASADDVGDDAANVQNIYILMRFADAFIQSDLQRGVGGGHEEYGVPSGIEPRTLHGNHHYTIEPYKTNSD